MSRIVFMGTPEAALPALSALAESHEVGLVVTQPDSAKGRSGTPSPSPVKRLAEGLGLPTGEPTSGGALKELVDSHGPFDLGVVVAYGRLIGSDVLALPRRGILNIHFSLLPRWRGAAPVERALMAGDPMTGVTIIKLDEGLDTGPVLTAQAVDIADGENSGSLTTRLSEIGANLLLSIIDSYLSAEVEPVVQSDEGLTYASKLTKADRLLDAIIDPEEFVNTVRALSPSPGATLDIDGRRHKVTSATISDAPVPAGGWVSIDGRPVVSVGDGAVEILELQPAGRRLQSGADWVRGRQTSSGQVGPTS